MSAAELDDDIIWQWWCRNAAAYGVGPVIDDPTVIARIVTLAFADDQGQGEGGGGRAP
jgi:hypothetical protein